MEIINITDPIDNLVLNVRNFCKLHGIRSYIMSRNIYVLMNYYLKGIPFYFDIILSKFEMKHSNMISNFMNEVERIAVKSNKSEDEILSMAASFTITYDVKFILILLYLKLKQDLKSSKHVLLIDFILCYW